MQGARKGLELDLLGQVADGAGPQGAQPQVVVTGAGEEDHPDVGVLGVDADVFRDRFDVRPGGNAPFDPQNEFVNKNLLYTARPLADVARKAGLSALEVVEVLEGARRALFERRAARPRPHLDGQRDPPGRVNIERIQTMPDIHRVSRLIGDK